MDSEKKAVLEKCKLFQGVDNTVLDAALGTCQELCLEKNEILYPERGIYVIASGKIGVYHSEEGRRVLLNVLTVSSVFGYASLYCDGEDKYTEIKSLGVCRLLFIDEEGIENLIQMDGRIALEIIKELTGKIRFLNKKLDSFASGDLKLRLWKYIKSLDYDEEGRARMTENMSALARRLGVGRASLYRLISELSEEGLIERRGSEIIMKKTADNKAAENK